MYKPLIGGRRSTIEILFEILSACRNGGLNKTAIMYRCSLSYDQLVRYLSFMGTQNLLVRNGTGQYELTGRGQEAFNHVEGVLTLLLGWQGNDKGDGRLSNGAAANG